MCPQCEMCFRVLGLHPHFLPASATAASKNPSPHPNPSSNFHGLLYASSLVWLSSPSPPVSTVSSRRVYAKQPLETQTDLISANVTGLREKLLH